MTLYYKGDGIYPAWQAREEASKKDGASWRPGRKCGKVWSKVLAAIALVEKLAAARGCGVEAAAAEWDRVLGGTKSKPGVASMCRAEEHRRLLAKVGL